MIASDEMWSVRCQLGLPVTDTHAENDAGHQARIARYVPTTGGGRHVPYAGVDYQRLLVGRMHGSPCKCDNCHLLADGYT